MHFYALKNNGGLKIRYKKIIFALTFILVVFAVTGVVSAAENITDDIVSVEEPTNDVLSVNNDTDNIVSVEETDEVLSIDDESDYLNANPDGTFTDLANDIANATGELKLSRNYVYDSTTDSNYANGIVIDKIITINGRGFIINGNNQARAFNVTSDKVILRNIEFTNCHSYNYGGAVYWNGNNGNLFDCNFIDCLDSGTRYSPYTSNSATCNSYGGAVYWNGNNGSLYDCNFRNCSSASKIQSINDFYSYGGAVYWKGNNGSLYGCNFEDCKSDSYLSKSTQGYGASSISIKCYSYGGAVYWDGSNGNLYNSNFVNSYSSSYTTTYTSEAYPDLGDRKCYSYAYGGAVYWKGNNGNLFESTFANSKSMSGSYAYFKAQEEREYRSYSYSYSYGGTVYWEGIRGSLYDCKVIESTSQSDSKSNSLISRYDDNNNHRYSYSYSCSYGGAFYWNGNEGSISNCNLVNSRSSSSGYSYCHSYSSNGQDRKFGYSYSYGDDYGGAIYYSGDDGSISNCNLINSSCSGHTTTHSSLSSSQYGTEYKSVDTYGGSIFWNGKNGYLFNATLINTTSTSGKGIFWNGIEGNMFNASFDGDYYNYKNYCISNHTVYPIILIHASSLTNNDHIVIFECTPLVNNVSVKLYNVTDRKILYDEFGISSEDLTSSLNLNSLEEAEYQIVIEYAGDEFYSSTSTNNLFKIGKNSTYEVTIKDNLIEGDNATINVTLNGDATGRVKITLDNYTAINELVGGKTIFNISYVKGGINTYKIKYEGDDKYNPIYITNTFNVLYKSNIKLNLKENSIYGEDIPLIYTITPNCTGNISILVDNVFKTNITVGTSFELENIDAGEHNITVIYNGDEYFSKSSDSITLMISKADPTIKVNSSKWPGDVSFEISLNETATGNVTLIIDEINSYPGNLTNGKTNIVVPNLNAGDHPVKIIYTGCKNYNNQTYTTTVTIDKIPTTVMGTVDDITYTENAPINVKGSVDGIAIVKIDETYIKNINVIANTITPATFENIPAGKHNVTITLKPTNANYNESKYNTDFTVSKKETTIDLNVVDSVYGKDVIVNVTASEDGKVILKVGSITREKNVLANTLTKINFGVLAANTYNVEVNFNAGENYKPSTKNDNIIISPAKAEILILQAENNVYGENTIIKVKTNVEGTLTFNIGSITRSFDIVANKLTSFNFGILDAKTYAVEVSLDAGNNYTKPINTTQVTIESKQTTVDVNVKNSTYGENVIVNVTASENGEISVNIGNTTKYVNVEANKVYSVDFSVLNANPYNVYVAFDGGNNYKKSYNNAFLIVSPAKSEITEIQAPNNAYGENTIIKAKTNADGVLTAKINTITKRITVNANQLTDIDFGILDVGNYEVKLGFDAGDNYISDNATKSFNVFKIDPQISISVTNATYGQTAKIIVNSNVGGNVTIAIGSVKTYENILINNNMAVQNINDVDAGNYTVKVTYNGNTNYNIKTYDAKLTIDKAPTNVVATVEDITYSQTTVINVKGSADGSVIVKIDENYMDNVNIVANTIASVTFDNVPAGKHNVSVILNPSKNYEGSSFNTDFTVSKKQTTVNLGVEDSVYGDDVIINVTASEDGKVTLIVGEIVRERNVLANTMARFNLGVLAAKSYDVEVSFDAGENYRPANEEDALIVSPATAKITEIQVMDNIYGENTIIKVKTDMGGVLTVKSTGFEKTFNIVANKLTSLDLGVLDANTYDVTITLDAGSNYTKPSGTAQITVTPKATSVDVGVKNSSYGENVIVNVTASEDGVITAKLGGITKVIDVTANILNNIDFGIVDANSYNLTISFTAGSNFKDCSSSKNILVSKAKSNIVSSPITVVYNSGEYLVVSLKDAHGLPIGGVVLDVDLNGIKNYPADANGIIKVPTVGLDVNDYVATITFAGNENYIGSNATATVNITQAAVNLSASYAVNVLDDGFKVNITVYTNPSINGGLSIKFDGCVYSVDVVNGTANFISNKVYSNTYPTEISYAGSVNFKDSASSVDVIVKATRVIKLNDFNYYYYNNDMGKDSEKGVSQIKVVDIDGKPIKNAVVTITIMNKYKLKVKTDARGVAKFTKAYKPGTYSVTATYDNKVTKLGNLVLKSVVNVPKVTTVKKSAKTTNLKITLKGTGPIKGKTVQVSFMKKNYKVTTDKNGVAIFKVTKDMVSKLAAGKTYTVRVTYRMDSVAQSIKIAN